MGISPTITVTFNSLQDIQGKVGCGWRGGGGGGLKVILLGYLNKIHLLDKYPVFKHIVCNLTFNWCT